MFRRRHPLAAGAAALAILASVAGVRAQGADPFLWLESVDGARAQAWVKAHDAKTASALRRDPHFAPFYAAALAINDATDRVPAPTVVGGRVYNFWQDARHVRGIWRRTTLADYAAPAPAWTTVLDLDALAAAEGKNWIWEGADCDSPSQKRCVVKLSDGGEDATTDREFDLTTGAFVPGGFALPHGKQVTAWADDDTLLVARAWAPGQLTTSGYPFVVKRLARGQALDAATLVFSGSRDDVSDDPSALDDGDGHRVLLVERSPSFFESEKYLVPAGAPGAAGTVRRVEVPLESSVAALVAGRALVTLQKPWTVAGSTFAQGSLVSLDLAAMTADPAHLAPTLVYAPGPRETLDAVSATRDRLFVTTYENVKGRAYEYAPAAGGAWTHTKLDLPDDSTVALVDADQHGTTAFVRVSSFLSPATMWLANTADGSLAAVKAAMPKFDASADAVDQYEATSKDGTRVPYFVVHPKAMALDGTNPTILYGYGGFGVSLTPSYSGTLGKLWLANGGVYVLANIRGGGEFGPAWHDAGLKTNRQRIYDDFAAVGRDVIARGITSPRHLGIEGGSNGGLLAGVEFTEFPQLWNAAAIEVPLLDMLRFEKIAAGASWVGEYGSVSVPEQRAFLAKISPYANVRKGVKYPVPFIFTTTKDDRVGPQHARKFAAELDSLGIPNYFYEVIEGGHGAGANAEERSFTSALTYTYFTKQLAEPSPAGAAAQTP